MSADTAAAVRTIIDACQDLEPVFREHISDNEGEVLPHLLMSDIIRWVGDNYASRPDVCRVIIARLEQEYIEGPEDVRGMIRVSGVEMIPDPGVLGSEIRELLGPELRKIDPWQDLR